MSLLTAPSRAFATTTHLSPSYPRNNALREGEETDSIRHLLSETSSLAPSDAISIQTGDGERTPRAHSPAPSHHQTQQQQQQPSTSQNQEEVPQPYRGFPSQNHYLAALQAWADEQKYLPVQGTTLLGFYGAKTMEEYASEPALDLGLRRKWRARRERKRSLVASSASASAGGAGADAHVASSSSSSAAGGGGGGARRS